MTSQPPYNILFLALSGIGNLIMQMPTIKQAKTIWPQSQITVWVAPRGTKVIAENESAIDETYEAPIKNNISGHLKTIQHLRNKNFDISFMLSPGQQLKGALYMHLAGIPVRVAHQYPFQGNPNSGLLLTHSLPEKEELHDLEQNLNLLSSLKSTPPLPAGGEREGVRGTKDILKNEVYKLKAISYKLPISPEHQKKVKTIISNLRIPTGKRLIGFHPGSAPDFTWKRWPLKNWADLAAELITNHQAHILIFGGPDEEEQKQQLQAEIQRRLKAKSYQLKATSIITTDLLTTGGILNKCNLFISNDSGLMHLAASVGTKTLGLFGPTDETKTGPRGPQVHTLRAPQTKPAYNTETNHNLGQESHPTIQSLTPNMVLQKISNISRK